MYDFVYVLFCSRNHRQEYFHKVDKIASGSSYKTLKLWEIHNFIFISEIHEFYPVSIRACSHDKYMYSFKPNVLEIVELL